MNIDIKHIAKLAKLHISEDELGKFEKEMENIVAMVEKMPDVDDAIVLDENHPMTLRDDIAVTDKYSRDELLKNAPKTKAGCVVVPKTVE